MTRRARAVMAVVAWLVGAGWLQCLLLWPNVTALVTAGIVFAAAMVGFVVLLVAFTIDWVKGEPEDESPERAA